MSEVFWDQLSLCMNENSKMARSALFTNGIEHSKKCENIWGDRPQ